MSKTDFYKTLDYFFKDDKDIPKSNHETCFEYDQLMQIRPIFLGAQDVYYCNDTMVQYFSKEIDGHKVADLIVKPQTVPLFGTLVKYNINNINSVYPYYIHDEKTFFKNLRISYHLQKFIKRINLIIGGCTIDQIYGNSFKSLRSIYNIEDNNIVPIFLFLKNRCVPYTCYHDIIIEIEFKKNEDNHNPLPYLELSVEQWEWNQNKSNLEQQSFFCQNLGPNIINNIEMKINLYFNHNVTHILVYSDCKIDSMSLWINEWYNLDIIMSKVKIIDKHYIISFVEDISAEELRFVAFNFSRIHDPYLIIKFDQKDYAYANEKEKEKEQKIVDISSVHSNIIRTIAGMSGLAYSN